MKQLPKFNLIFFWGEGGEIGPRFISKNHDIFIPNTRIMQAYTVCMWIHHLSENQLYFLFNSFKVRSMSIRKLSIPCQVSSSKVYFPKDYERIRCGTAIDAADRSSCWVLNWLLQIPVSQRIWKDNGGTVNLWIAHINQDILYQTSYPNLKVTINFLRVQHLSFQWADAGKNQMKIMMKMAEFVKNQRC